MCTTIITNVTNIDKKVVERAAKKRQKNGATSPTLFTKSSLHSQKSPHDAG